MFGCLGRDLEPEGGFARGCHWGSGNFGQGPQEPRGRRECVVRCLHHFGQERFGQLGQVVVTHRPGLGLLGLWGATGVPPRRSFFFSDQGELT